MGLFDSIGGALGSIGGAIGGLFGGPVGSVLGTAAGGLIGGVGSSRGQDIQDQYAGESLALQREMQDKAIEAQLFGQRPWGTNTIFGGLGVDPETRALSGWTGGFLNDQLQQILGGRNRYGGAFGLIGGEPIVSDNRELGLLRELTGPRDDKVRAQLRSDLFNRGRLGLATGGGRTGKAFQPEIAALEEALAGRDLEMARGAIGSSRAEDTRRLNAWLQLQNQLSNTSLLGLEPIRLGIGAAGGNVAVPPISTAPLQQAANYATNANDAFWGSLGQAVSGLDFGSLFGGGNRGYTGQTQIANTTSSPGAFGLFAGADPFATPDYSIPFWPG